LHIFPTWNLSAEVCHVMFLAVRLCVKVAVQLCYLEFGSDTVDGILQMLMWFWCM